MDPTKTSAGLRILLVEDDKHDRMAFRQAFEKRQASCQITGYERAEEAMERLRADASSFDLVVVDHGLPGMSGLDLCKELLDEEVPLPLVILTGRGSEELAVEALKAGVDDYIIKEPSLGYLDLLPVVLPEAVRKHGDRLARKRIEKELQEARDELEERVVKRTAELAKTVALLKQEITERKRVEYALRESENKYRTLLENLPQKIFHKDKNSVYVSCNENYARDLKINPDEIKGKTDYEFFPEELADKYIEDDTRIIASEKTEEIEEKYLQDGQEKWVQTVKTPVKDDKGNIAGVLGIFWDITEHKRSQDALRRREAELEIKSNSLEEANAALRVLLKQREEDRAELQEKVLSNIKELVVPYVEKLRHGRLDSKQVAYLGILESNLNDITAPFSHKLSSKYSGLTPTEIQIAHLVKDGKTTKEIAQLLNVSTATVESHRKGIRMKIGIKNKKANLRSYLLSM